VLSRLGDSRERIRKDYRAVLGLVLGRGLPTAVGTGDDAIPGLARVAATGLGLFNDAILRECFPSVLSGTMLFAASSAAARCPSGGSLRPPP
jgi:hypothetical protein